MGPTEWLNGVDVAMTVCDADARITFMNARAARTFEADGGFALIGTDLLACHPEPARGKLLANLKARRRNVYTIEKAGKRKLICQEPILEDGRFAGLVEISLELPPEMPHFVREG
ncbi:MAG: diguanylate cyclase [Planctomycetes bacterium]|nr:diguanylate cyclase [Planctomycetota bacterium]